MNGSVQFRWIPTGLLLASLSDASLFNFESRVTRGSFFMLPDGINLLLIMCLRFPDQCRTVGPPTR